MAARETHGTIRDGKRLVWYTERLWSEARTLKSFDIDLSQIPELDHDCWFNHGSMPTLRNVADHCRRINHANLEWPIILNSDGSLMDGGHRVCKALLAGHKTIRAVRFAVMPKPDEVHELDA